VALVAFLVAQHDERTLRHLDPDAMKRTRRKRVMDLQMDIAVAQPPASTAVSNIEPEKSSWQSLA